MISRRVVKSHSKCQASMFGTTRSADASEKNLFICFTHHSKRQYPVRVREKRGGEERRRPLTYIWGSDSIAVPWNTKHPIACGFDDKVMGSFLASFGRDDVLDSAISAEATCDSLEWHPVCCVYHGFATWVKFDYRG